MRTNLKMKNGILTVLCIIFFITTLVLIAILGVVMATNGSENQTDDNNSFDAVTKDEAVLSTENEMISISTPYCELSYPKEYESYLKHSDTEENGGYTKTFYCCIKGLEMEMFRVHFNRADIGIKLGSVKYGDTVVAFSVDSKEFIPDVTWTDEESRLYYGMSEAINDVINSVEATEGYIANK